MTIRERRAGWPRLLNEHLAEAQERYAVSGLTWGEFDCATFVSDWVMKCATRPRDPMAEYRGRYDSQETAMQVLRVNGDGTLMRAVASRIGKEVHPANAQRGDVAYIEKQDCLGIVIAVGVKTMAVFLSDGGLGYLPIGKVNKAFRV